MKFVIALSAATLVAAATPERAAAADCTLNYARCISEAGLLDEPFQTLKDVECGAEYVGCVSRKLITW